MSMYKTRLVKTLDYANVVNKPSFGTLSLKNSVDLSTDVVNVLPIDKIDATSLQPLISSTNAASIRSTLGLSSTATSGMLDWGNVTGKPSFGALSSKSSIDLSSTGDVSGILPISKVNVSTLQPLDATLTSLSSASPSIPKSLKLTNSTQGSNLPTLTLLGDSGNLNSVSIQMAPWAARPGGISTKIAAIDDNAGGARLALYAASGSDNAPLTEFLSGASSGVTISKPLTVAGNLNLGNFPTPVGITTELGGTSPILNLESNFHVSNKNNAYPGLCFRLDNRGNGAFAFFTRGATLTSEVQILNIDNTGILDLYNSSDSALRVSGGVSVAKTLSCGEVLKTQQAYYMCYCNTLGYVLASTQQSPLSVGSWGYSSNHTSGTNYLSVPYNGVYTITASIIFDTSSTPAVQYLTNVTTGGVLTMNRSVSAPLTWTGFLLANTSISWTIRAAPAANLAIGQGSTIILALMYRAL
ncbi:hypothetical protein DFS34DRAFT_622908 [Phlyctochytrium arcticum]|nr:hypothetical protein DFS34DRAFT_622908 [Phlyctochytrium arcticum]